MTLRSAARCVRQAGGRVTLPRRTGEALFQWRDYRVRVNWRRKDTPRHLWPLLRAISSEAATPTNAVDPNAQVLESRPRA